MEGDNREQRRGGGYGCYVYGGIQLGYGSGTCTYRVQGGLTPPPARVTLKWIKVERVELYSYVPPPGENIPIYVKPFLVDDSVPTEDDIEGAVKRLQNKHSRRPSEMRPDHLKEWLAAARQKEK